MGIQSETSRRNAMALARSASGIFLFLEKGIKALANAEYKVCCSSASIVEATLWRVGMRRASDLSTLDESDPVISLGGLPARIPSAPSCRRRGDNCCNHSSSICKATTPSTSIVFSHLPSSTSLLHLANVTFSGSSRSRMRQGEAETAAAVAAVHQARRRSQQTWRILGTCLSC